MDMKLRQVAGIIFIIMILTMLYVVTIKASEGFMDANRCGVGLPPCVGERVRCINGYCKSDITPSIPKLSDLQIIP